MNPLDCYLDYEVLCRGSWSEGEFRDHRILYILKNHLEKRG
jgi:hypothetical protein